MPTSMWIFHKDFVSSCFVRADCSKLVPNIYWNNSLKAFTSVIRTFPSFSDITTYCLKLHGIKAEITSLHHCLYIYTSYRCCTYLFIFLYPGACCLKYPPLYAFLYLYLVFSLKLHWTVMYKGCIWIFPLNEQTKCFFELVLSV